jgi:glyoxylase-like metal-dependent hydrolase (beta-lactamase superfamily II)
LRGNDRDITIDAGLGVVAGLREAIPGLFERDPLVLLTHAHLDHVGRAAEFGDRPPTASNARP